jgi:galactokinase
MNPEKIAAVKRHFEGIFKQQPEWVAAAPGRTELLGNHTDHNNGRVLAAAIDLHTQAAFRATESQRIRLHSGRFEPVDISLKKALPPAGVETSPERLVCGIIDSFRHQGLVVGGVDAVLDSSIPVGVGLSSSAAFELVIITILDVLYNEGELPAETRAMIGQQAESRYCGKPCGLMDQLACVCGGIVALDFALPKAPRVECVDFDFEAHGYRLAVVNTGGSHADMSGHYAAVAQEMHHVAQIMNCRTLRELKEEALMANLAFIRRGAGDRALQRALHYFDENRRVDQALAAIKADDIEAFFRAVNASGKSSAVLLQNLYPAGTHHEQPLAAALAVADRFLGKDGACRVHGGGFAGAIQAYVPVERFAAFRAIMEGLFGDDCVVELHVEPQGAGMIL